MTQTKIVLSTFNARYKHTSLALRYLYANLGDLQAQSKIREFVINQSPRDVAEELLKANPAIIGFSVYIWNVEQTKNTIQIIKQVNPKIKIVLGGPEVSYENRELPITKIADHVVSGEADLLFRDLCLSLLLNTEAFPDKFISAGLPEITQIKLPYEFYTAADIQNRNIYVEASRGCPYKCEYCISSLDKSVRAFDLDTFLNQMDFLLSRGARQFKFLDRTFNLNLTVSSKILQFFLDRIQLGLFLHFEMVPDRLPEGLREILKKFPEGALQFEIGVQTWNPLVAKNVSRRQDYEKVKDNFRFLTTETGIHIHADLIAGLPGEDIHSFAEGFDQLIQLGPHEIQLGLLKRLKGTPLTQKEIAFSLVYQLEPPYQILSTADLTFFEIQRLERFARFWDKYSNSGKFNRLVTTLKEQALLTPKKSFFWLFDEFSGFLDQQIGQSHSISLSVLASMAHKFLVEILNIPESKATEIISADYLKVDGREKPEFLKSHSLAQSSSIPKRQARHLSDKKG